MREGDGKDREGRRSQHWLSMENLPLFCRRCLVEQSFVVQKSVCKSGSWPKDGVLKCQAVSGGGRSYHVPPWRGGSREEEEDKCLLLGNCIKWVQTVINSPLRHHGSAMVAG